MLDFCKSFKMMNEFIGTGTTKLMAFNGLKKKISDRESSAYYPIFDLSSGYFDAQELINDYINSLPLERRQKAIDDAKAANKISRS